MGVLLAPPKRSFEEEVMPWLIDKIVDFLEEDQAIVQGSSNVVVDGILDSQNDHAATIRAKYERL